MIKTPTLKTEMFAAVAFTLASLIIVLYWSFAKYDPLVFKDNTGIETKVIEVTNRNKRVENEGAVKMKFNFCKTVSAVGVVEVNLVGRALQPLPMGNDTTKKECRNNFVVPILLPKLVSFEPRKICYRIHYPVNPIRTITEEFCSQQFNVYEIEEEKESPKSALPSRQPLVPQGSSTSQSTTPQSSQSSQTTNNSTTINNPPQPTPAPQPTPTPPPATPTPQICGILPICNIL